MARRFLRAVGLTAMNEARLLIRDPVSLLMLMIAPVVIMTVAGFSLGALYGNGTNVVTVPVVDPDGILFTELERQLRPEEPLRLERATDLAEVRSRLLQSGEAPVAVEIPPGAHAALRAGRDARLVVYVDPARRVQADAVELRLAALQRRTVAAAHAEARRRAAQATRELRHELAHLDTAVRRRERRLRSDLGRAEDTVGRTLHERWTEVGRQVESAAARATDDARAELAARAAVLERLRTQLQTLENARPAFERWLAELRAKAGRHAGDIPPPPPFPSGIAAADLAALTAPLSPPERRLRVAIPAMPPLDLGLRDALAGADDPPSLRFEPAVALPGALDVVERPAVDGAAVVANAFDQYVPGFGVTFLLIGMMLGVSLTLFDERDWGTLDRVRAGGASLSGILIGKVMARVVVGVAQMILLFAVGRLLFGITLGRAPAALLLPTVGMSFAGAALGLVIPTLAPAHDSVMPLGTMTSLALAAIGGCWWPLDFEPAWMRAAARWLPTTWTMQAYNDLMIRNAPPSAALTPFLVTTALGTVLLAIGIAAGVGGRE